MFDDEKDNENWDNVNPAPQDSGDEPSWDEILSDENMSNLSSEDSGLDDFVINFDDENAAVNNIDSYMEQSKAQNISQEPAENTEAVPSFDVEDDEPIIETTSSSEQGNVVENIYEEPQYQNEQQNMDNKIQEAQAELTEDFEDEAPSLASQSESNPNEEKPIGIRQDNKSLQPVVYGVLAAIIIGVVMGGVYLNFFSNKGNNDLTASDIQTQTEDIQTGNNEEGNIPNEGIEQQMPQEQGRELGGEKPQDKKVTIDVVNTGRSNPFTPVGNFSDAGYTLPKGLDVMAPPSLNKDMPVNKLVEIVVSGILYDNVKPSAIITVGGVDHFVQRGDAVDEYVVSYIGPTQVTIRSGRNNYTASIGQQFNVNDRIEGQTTYVRGKNGVTRQYFSPSSVDIETKNDDKGLN